MVGHRDIRRVALAFASTGVLAACAATPDLGPRPTLPTPAGFATARSFESPAAKWPQDQWWKAYGDPELDRLIDEGLAGSPTLAIAAARVRQAQAAAEETGALGKPSLGAQGAIQTKRLELTAVDAPQAIALPSGWKTRANASLRLDYQLDFFGRNRAALAAATSQAEAARAEAAAARLELATAIAATYADLQRLLADREAALEVIRLRDDSASLVAQRLKSGLENDGQLSQAASEAASARAELAAVDGSIAKARNALAALVGKGPDRGLDIPLPRRTTLAARGLPADASLDLVGRRPDLVAARLRAEAAARRIDVAKADFYPNVSLSALVGLQTLGVGGGRTTFGQIGPAVSLPIFSGGRLEGAYRGARADYDEAVASYDQALAVAFREVADALADRRALDARLTHTRRALSAAQAAYGVARTRYQGGLLSYADTLSAENGLVAQRRAAADLEARAFALDVALVKALGGGFTQS